MTTEAAPARRGFRWVQAVTALVAFLILCGLGTWQVQRLGWKTDLLARIAALQAAPAEPLNVVLNRLGDGIEVDYTRVQAACPSLEQTPTVRLNALQGGVLGYRLITACPLEGSSYRSILVDRGYVAAERVDEARPSSAPLAGPIVGVLRRGDPRSRFAPPDQPGEGLWYSRDVPAMAARLAAPAPAPVFLMLESPVPAGGLPVPAPVPVDIANNHLGYAVTWYGLALALAGVYIALLRRDRRK